MCFEDVLRMTLFEDDSAIVGKEGERIGSGVDAVKEVMNE